MMNGFNLKMFLSSVSGISHVFHALQGYSVLVEAWGHEEVDSSKFHILTTFVVPVTQSLGEWSANKVYNDPYPAEIALQVGLRWC